MHNQTVNVNISTINYTNSHQDSVEMEFTKL